MSIHWPYRNLKSWAFSATAAAAWFAIKSLCNRIGTHAERSSYLWTLKTTIYNANCVKIRWWFRIYFCHFHLHWLYMEHVLDSERSVEAHVHRWIHGWKCFRWPVFAVWTNFCQKYLAKSDWDIWTEYAKWYCCRFKWNGCSCCCCCRCHCYCNCCYCCLEN